MANRQLRPLSTAKQCVCVVCVCVCVCVGACVCLSLSLSVSVFVFVRDWFSAHIFLRACRLLHMLACGLGRVFLFFSC